MQVTEVANEGLKRAFSITVSATSIAADRDKRLAVLGRDMKLPGFRPGKVPAHIVKQRYGQAVMGEVLEQSVEEASRQVVTDRGLRPAQQPKIEVVNFADGADLEFRMDFEILPEIPMPDFSSIAIERLKAEPSEEAIHKALENIASRNRGFEDVEEVRPAVVGDVVSADFVGRVVPNLIANPGVEGAGAPATLPTGFEAVDGASVTVIGTGRDGGFAYVDLQLADGAVALGGAVELTSGEGVLSARLSVQDGSAEIAFGVQEIGAEGILRTLTTALAPFGADRAEARFTLTGDATATRPLLIVTGGPVTLRVALPRYMAGDAVLAEPFPGGTAEDAPIEIGGGNFIPGFAEQLEGISPGEQRDVLVAFPVAYGSKDLAGKEAVFAITAKGLKRAVTKPIDDELAKGIGFEGLDPLKNVIREQLQREYDQMSRMRVKRLLLDKLAEQANFAVPEGMVEAEFKAIWDRIEEDRKAGNVDSDDAGKDDDALKAEYRTIAERRIRLGLMLSEIGRTNNVQVSAEEMQRAMRQEAGKYPGQEQMVIDFFRKNPQAAEGLRAPIFEEKVVDFMLELAQVTDRVVPPEEIAAT
ncbi:MAG: tig [Rhodospirillales bacterium]|jgi:FKBP-type peptidyl-prolyl cis-trans isomerase (trigger factor)|nr:tig [Rhodospirillales bacterium]